ncbi:glycosyltransferase [Terasakiella sp. SH-1]|uniref:glycosyltransferase n=1 Tax=Terasakiella sp. SH-1 TaxID=2560057 RepID=UPI001074057B|nr:glycosyltransferase [Terasakiella sp. SH-1]
MTKNKTITYVIGTTNIGGAEMHLLRICRGLVTRGWTINLYSLSEPGKLSDDFEKAGVSVQHALSVPFTGLMRKPFRLLSMFIQVLRLFCHFLFQRPNITHFFLPAAYLVGGPLSVLAANPIRLMSRRSLNIYQQRRPFFAKIEKKLHSYMHGILGNSKAVIENLNNDEYVSESKLGLIYNGIEIEPFALQVDQKSIRQSIGLKESDLVFILVANLIPYKGHMDLINALDLIEKDLPENWQVICAGYDNGYRKHLVQRLQELKLEHKVHFLGQRTDIGDLLKSSDIGLLCSHEEGFSNAVLEAMASGLPMVVTNVGGNPDVVENNKNGYIVPAKNPAELAQALLRISKDSNKMKEMGLRGQELIKEKFSIETCVAQYEELYQSMLNNKSLPESIKTPS